MKLAKTIPVDFEEIIDFKKLKESADELIKQKFSERKPKELGLFSDAARAVYYYGFTDSDCNNKQIWCLQHFLDVIALIEDCKPEKFQGRSGSIFTWCVAGSRIKTLGTKVSEVSKDGAHPLEGIFNRITKKDSNKTLSFLKKDSNKTVSFLDVLNECIEEISKLRYMIVVPTTEGPDIMLCERGGRTRVFFEDVHKHIENMNKRLNRPKVQEVDALKDGAVGPLGNLSL